MITWKYTNSKVMAKMGFLYEFITVQLKHITRHEKIVVKNNFGHKIEISIRVNKLTFIDETGTEYNTYLSQVDFILPCYAIPPKNIYELMNAESGDYVDEI